nr:hypothetical protein [Cytophagales bacterium]
MIPIRYQELLEISHQRSLKAEEFVELEKIFCAYPDSRAQWQEDKTMDSLLKQLSVSAPSVDICHRVMHTIQQENMQKCARKQSIFRYLSFFAKVDQPISAIGAAIFLFSLSGVFLINETETFKVDGHNPDYELNSLPGISNSDVPSPDVLQDFAAIIYSAEVEKMIDTDLLSTLASTQ